MNDWVNWMNEDREKESRFMCQTGVYEYKYSSPYRYKYLLKNEYIGLLTGNTILFYDVNL